MSWSLTTRETTSLCMDGNVSISRLTSDMITSFLTDACHEVLDHATRTRGHYLGAVELYSTFSLGG